MDIAHPPQINSDLNTFAWQPQPTAAALIGKIVNDFLGRCSVARNLADRMKSETGTRFTDWIDRIALPGNGQIETQLADAGFVKSAGLFKQPHGIFPSISLADDDQTSIFIKMESAADFATANGLEAHNIFGQPLAELRQLKIAEENSAALWAIERHGAASKLSAFDPQRAISIARHLENFRTRKRAFENESAGFDHTADLISNAIADLDTHLACDLFFTAEREFWQRRNSAAQFQKARQDRLGLGWANHDHHTYRSSREYFGKLIALLEMLGFTCRERFYAGAQAGWGAQVLEQTSAGIVVFADVDLSADELVNDFAHAPLTPRETLGTVGLWCALHGEAILQAGMHHLECQFDFDALREQLGSHGIGVMKPFTDFPFLRQAFTQGERWMIDPRRIGRLLSSGQISAEQAEQFRNHGAIGSHLENLERNDGFKGFNQTGVSDIIVRTDPRRSGA